MFKLISRTSLIRGINQYYYHNHPRIPQLSTLRRYSISSKLLQLQQQLQQKPMVKMSEHVLPLTQPVVPLDCTVAFNALESKEKRYAHYLSRASFWGSLTAIVQTSPESPLLISTLLKLFQENNLTDLKSIATTKAGFTDDDWKAFLVYTAGVFTNSGNYKSFGDTKIVPGVPAEKLDVFMQNFGYEHWNTIKDKIYSLTEREKQLGLGDKGTTTYFSSNCDKEDAERVNRFFKEQKIQAYMTRCFKTVVGGDVQYEIRTASASVHPPKEFTFENAKFVLTFGDYGPFMEKTCHYLKKARENTDNELEIKILDAYINCFCNGSLESHIEGSRHWIQNKGPTIETYIGFIETYRDPIGVRGEFEGFVSIVNRPMSVKYQTLVERAGQLLPLLPWPRSFERDTFMKPDFTSLDVLCFGGSGIPAGINIPNYDEIRLHEGFKNVALGNVIQASYQDTVIPFLNEEDQKLLQKWRTTAFELQVGLHELLGHGSGKSLKKADVETVNPLTKQKIATWYGEEDTYDQVFTTLGSAYEECRAECVGLYLSLVDEVLRIFGHENSQAKTVKYVNWLSMAYSGLKSLEMYQPHSNAWGQAHSQARFAILQVMLEAGGGLLKIEEKNGDLLLELNEDLIDTIGKACIGDFLLKLQVFKSMADLTSAQALFDKYSKVDGIWLQWRDIVMAKRQPRKLIVQPNTSIEGNDVILKNYEPTPEGVIQSWIERFKDNTVYDGLHSCWKKDKVHFE